MLWLADVTLPLIGRSSHAHGIFFTEQDWELNKAEGKSARLINFPDIPFDDYPDKHKEYIRLGEANGENSGYKCKIRDHWYIVPSVWVPDAFFLRRNNLYPKLFSIDAMQFQPTPCIGWSSISESILNRFCYLKPQYAKVILEGKKRYEFRKTKPKQNVTRIVFYASAPQMQVVGEATIDSIVEGTPDEFWKIAKTAAGITKKFFFSYYMGKEKAFAYLLKDVIVYDNPKSLKDYGINHAPQSYV